MLTKQQIADEFKALETEVHALCTQAWTSMSRHTVIKQMPKRRELMAACEATGGHVFAVSGKCKFCHASNDRPNVANLGVATGVDAGLSEHKYGAASDFAADAQSALEYALIGEPKKFRYGDLREALGLHKPAPEVISKAPDALPAARHRCVGVTIGDVKYRADDSGNFVRVE